MISFFFRFVRTLCFVTGNLRARYLFFTFPLAPSNKKDGKKASAASTAPPPETRPTSSALYTHDLEHAHRFTDALLLDFDVFRALPIHCHRRQIETVRNRIQLKVARSSGTEKPSSTKISESQESTKAFSLHFWIAILSNKKKAETPLHSHTQTVALALRSADTKKRTSLSTLCMRVGVRNTESKKKI